MIREIRIVCHQPEIYKEEILELFITWFLFIRISTNLYRQFIEGEKNKLSVELMQNKTPKPDVGMPKIANFPNFSTEQLHYSHSFLLKNSHGSSLHCFLSWARPGLLQLFSIPCQFSIKLFNLFLHWVTSFIDLEYTIYME